MAANAQKSGDPLANPVWHALTGRQAEFADSTGDGRAHRYHADVNIFGAVDRLDADGWEAAADLVGPEGIVVFFREEIPPAPEGWTELHRENVHQMIAGKLQAAPAISLEPLSARDAPEMLELAQATEPGPFFERTLELGGYRGVRRDGRLIAMAGERMRLPGLSEISAVCTHESARRQGLAAALTLAVAESIRARGEEAFLHVIEENENAVRLYRALGFEPTRLSKVVAAKFDGGPGGPLVPQ